MPRLEHDVYEYLHEILSVHPSARSLVWIRSGTDVGLSSIIHSI